MDAAGEEGGPITYDQVERHFNSLEGPSAQERIDYIVPLLISLLPPPYVPVPEAESDSDSDDESFSLTSSDSDGPDAGADHAAFTAVPGDGEDRISRLPETLLSDIIHRLPTKDARRTAALSPHWRRVWAATPLLVDDAHLLGAGGTSDIPVMRALSRCVAAHPGPVRSVRATHISFYSHEYALQRLVADLADKRVQELILFNRPWPLNMPLPDDVFRCTSLHSLYLGVWDWNFPKATAAHPPAFPDLRELGLFHCTIGNRDLDALLAHCPKLELLSLVMSYHDPSRLHLASHSLKVAVHWMSSFDEVIVDAPRLERLLFQSIVTRRPVKIVSAPRLEVLGILDLDLHMLEIGGTVISPGMKVSASNMVPSLKILAVQVHFGCNREAKMLPTLLKCFPRLKTIHILPVPSESPDRVHDLGFWQSRSSCECLESHLETVIFYGSQSEKHEIGFVRYVLREGKALKTLGFVCTDEKARNFRASAEGASCEFSVCFFTPRWSFQAAIDSSLDDPFAAARA